MLRLFFWLSGFVVAMILVAGSAVYWLSTSNISQARQQESEAVAKSAALGIAGHIGQINATLDKMAQDPEVFTALLAHNQPLLNLAAIKLEQHLPDNLKIWLLLPDVTEPDQAGSPRMGFADLAMVREAITGNPSPAIQGEKSDRHLAIARRIVHDDRVIGVILASFDYGFARKNLSAATTQNVALELRQANVALAKAGIFRGEKTDDLPSAPVPGTNWTIAYESHNLSHQFELPILSAIFLPAFFGGLAFFVAYRLISEILIHDVNNLMKMFKDMMTNNLQGNYPFHLGELSALYSNLLQFKRVLEKSDPQTKFDEFQTNNIHVQERNPLFDEFEITIDDEDLDLNGLFDDKPLDQAR